MVMVINVQMKVGANCFMTRYISTKIVCFLTKIECQSFLVSHSLPESANDDFCAGLQKHSAMSLVRSNRLIYYQIDCIQEIKVVYCVRTGLCEPSRPL